MKLAHWLFVSVKYSETSRQILLLGLVICTTDFSCQVWHLISYRESESCLLNDWIFFLKHTGLISCYYDTKRWQAKIGSLKCHVYYRTQNLFNGPLLHQSLHGLPEKEFPFVQLQEGIFIHDVLQDDKGRCTSPLFGTLSKEIQTYTIKTHTFQDLLEPLPCHHPLNIHFVVIEALMKVVVILT